MPLPRRVLRIAMYVLLLLSAGATFLFGDRLWAAVRTGALPVWAPLLAPLIFTVFVGVYTTDRWLLVRRHGSSLARAFLQVAFAVAFLTLLWPQQAASYREAVQAQDVGDPALKLLRHPEPEVRALACEVLGLRAGTEANAAITAALSGETSGRAQRACQLALERLATRASPGADPSAPTAPPPDPGPPPPPPGLNDGGNTLAPRP